MEMLKDWTRAVGMERKEQTQEVFQKGTINRKLWLFMDETDKSILIFN